MPENNCISKIKNSFDLGFYPNIDKNDPAKTLENFDSRIKNVVLHAIGCMAVAGLFGLFIYHTGGAHHLEVAEIYAGTGIVIGSAYLIYARVLRDKREELKEEFGISYEIDSDSGSSVPHTRLSWADFLLRRHLDTSKLEEHVSAVRFREETL